MNYLYNGVELPELPERDKTKYPYAYIEQGTNVITGALAYGLWYSSVPCCLVRRWIDNNEYYVYDFRTTDAPATLNQMILVDGTWKGFGETTYNSSVRVFWLTPSDVDKVIWCNTDLMFSIEEDSELEVGEAPTVSDELYLAASTPVPVGGSTPLDPTALLMGWMVGRRLAEMRK